MHKIATRTYIALFACLALGVCLFTAACSDQDRDGGSSPQPKTSTVTLKVTNAYGLYIPRSNYAVIYNSTAGEGKTSNGKVDYTVVDGVGSCTIAFAAEGENVAVTSVKLSNPTNDIPFEWLDYGEPQAVTEGELELDVAINNFAGGDGSADSPYLVGNPRQLDNVRNNCGTATNYRQIRDIDFEGSCGLAVDVSVNKTDHEIVYSDEVQDATARFYNSGKGWAAIGTSDDIFMGSYDGAEHAIDGLVLFNPEGDYQGLFGFGADACVFSNLTLGETCVVVGSNITAALLGGINTSDSTLTIKSCHSRATVGGKTNVAELVGFVFVNQGEISDSSCSGKTFGNAFTAGFAGFFKANEAVTISRCQSSGEVYCVGGPSKCAGYFASLTSSGLTFSDCACTGKFLCFADSSAADPQFGGFVGIYIDNDFGLAFSGESTVDAIFDFTNCETTDVVAGGVIGALHKGDTHKHNLVDALAPLDGKVKTTGLPAGSCTGLYCGNPQINSLD